MIDVQHTTEHVMVTPDRDLTSSYSQRLRHALLDLIEQGGRRVVIDFRHINVIDSLDIGMLLSIQNALKARGGELVLQQVPHDIAEMFNIMRLNAHLVSAVICSLVTTVVTQPTGRTESVEARVAMASGNRYDQQRVSPLPTQNTVELLCTNLSGSLVQHDALLEGQLDNPALQLGVGVEANAVQQRKEEWEQRNADFQRIQEKYDWLLGESQYIAL